MQGSRRPALPRHTPSPRGNLHWRRPKTRSPRSRRRPLVSSCRRAESDEERRSSEHHHNREGRTMAKELTDRERIAALEAQNQQLTSEIAALRAAGRPEPRQQQAAPIADEGVTTS